MPVPFPHRYSATLCRTLASRARIEAPPRAALHGGPSPELDGDVDAWSPEHMLLSSLGLCMLTTFEAFAARDGIDLVEWRAQVHGTVEQTPEGPMFTSIVLELDIEIAGNVEQFEATLEDAKRYCLVQNALRVPVVVEVELRTPYGDSEDDEIRAVVEMLRRSRQPRPAQARGQLHAV
ncbi:MAG: OsmC family protein [Deltaproteobacteria bacterium]|nr:MAG: OsmC family protein [Deltaproteobacteria bacterium]